MDTSSGEHAEAAAPPTEGIIGGIAGAFNSARQVVSDLFRLFSLEVRRAGLTLVWMVALAVMAALLMVTAWLGLMGALAFWTVSLGMTWIGAMVAIAVLNLVTAAIVIFSCVTLSRALLFPATRRQLEPPPTRQDVK